MSLSKGVVASETPSPASSKAYIAYEVIGFTMSPVSGFRGGFYLQNDLALTASYSSVSAEVVDFKFKKSITEIGAKFFTGSSFYYGLSLGMEDFSFDTLTSELDKLTGNVSTLGISGVIGNQWNTGNFTIGCDWIGFYRSLSSSVTIEAEDSLGDVVVEVEKQQALDNLGGSSIHLLRFYLGVAF